MLAALCAVFLVVARRRFAEPPTRWPSAIRLGILTFFAVLAASCGVDACLIGFQRNAIRERIRPGLSRLVPSDWKLIQRDAGAAQNRIEGPPFESNVGPRPRASASIGERRGGKSGRNR